MSSETLGVKESGLYTARSHELESQLESLALLPEMPDLKRMGGKAFGRSIESSLKALSQTQEPIGLSLRRQDLAVVLSVSQYEEILKMKALYQQLVVRLKQHEIGSVSSEYDRLYERITSLSSREAADQLFGATGDELGHSYNPGGDTPL
ncbi:MAG: hypothetical protein ACPF9H_01085 [Aequoribacter sp.]|uniref:hypothetical protein n=1 Tax=Aequoribacter sp. TaxID=2847771 RepID=UPI003C3B664B